ncbi:MAG: tilS [Geminicoccaceae bacterium]|nr:tilS [Geminicoccaceae bacterium]
MPSASDPPPAAALDVSHFAALMAALGPFERGPRLAVAVSGGADSLALAFLAERWARERGGAIAGLVVDHGLRPESEGEARRTATWLAARGIPGHILPWQGVKPATGLQAAARGARYELLGAWCRAAGVLHLMTAHHREDQAETVALRVARGSGADGLAGMAPIRELPGLRLLRPLLRVPKAALVAVLVAAGQPWLEDPSNRATRFARARLRQAGLDVAHFGALADESAAWRGALDRAVAAWLAQHARIAAAGFVLLAHPALAAAPAAIARRAVQQALLAVGGKPYAPRQARLEPLLEALRAGRIGAGRTLGGCRILRRGERLLICREPGAISEVIRPRAGEWHLWDRRFAVRVGGEVAGLRVAALGAAGWRQRARLPMPADLPAAVAACLPALWQGDRLLAVAQPGAALPDRAQAAAIEARYRPPQPLAGAPFAAGTGPDPAPGCSGPRPRRSLLRGADHLC